MIIDRWGLWHLGCMQHMVNTFLLAWDNVMGKHSTERVAICLNSSCLGNVSLIYGVKWLIRHLLINHSRNVYHVPVPFALQERDTTTAPFPGKFRRHAVWEGRAGLGARGAELWWRSSRGGRIPELVSRRNRDSSALIHSHNLFSLFLVIISRLLVCWFLYLFSFWF